MAIARRYRNFAIVFYLDSAPGNWMEIITDWHVEAYLSPLHDSDYNPDRDDDGEFECKKAHYHLLITFDGKKSRDQAQELSDQLSGVQVEIVQSIRGYARYLCHLDNPEKHQYSTADVISFSGGDYISIIGLPYDRHKILDEITVFCMKNQIDTIIGLKMYAIRYNPEWSRVINDNTVYVNYLVRSIQWAMERGRKGIRVGDEFITFASLCEEEII